MERRAEDCPPYQCVWLSWVGRVTPCAPPRLDLTPRCCLRTDAHRHQDVEKWSLNFQYTRTHLVDEIEKDFVLSQCAQRSHEKFWIKRDGEFATLVGNGERFFGFADFRSGSGNIDIVLGEI